MPEIKFKFHATLREKIGKGELLIKANDFGEAIEALRYQLGDDLSRELFKEDGSLKDYYLLFLNGKVMRARNLREKKVKKGDILSIFPPVAGG